MNEEIAFWILAAIAVLGALVAVRKRNLIHGVFALLVFFAGLSGLFLLLLAEFIAAVLSNEGGFYRRFAYVAEARRMGVAILPPCVNASAWRCTWNPRTAPGATC